MIQEVEAILQQSLTRSPTRDEALFLLEHTTDDEEAEALYATARKVREQERGNEFRICGGVAMVLRCNLKPYCLYCPYWREQGKVPLTLDEIIKAVEYMNGRGIRDFHLSGGTTLGSEGKDILSIVKGIYEAGFRDVSIDVNCGAAMSVDTLLELKQYNVKLVRSVFETLNPQVFRTMKPGDDLEKKKAFARAIGEAGLELGTGLLAGLSPEETKYQDYVDFLFEVKDYPHLRSLYVSKFYPYDTIALKGYQTCSSQEAARVIALARLILRDVNIGGAQGWGERKSEKQVTPLWAGAGNGFLGVHISRTPAYIDITKQGPHVTYRDGMEYRDNIEPLREYYHSLGIKTVF